MQDSVWMHFEDKILQSIFSAVAKSRLHLKVIPVAFQGSVIFLFWFGFLPAKWNRKSEHIVIVSIMSAGILQYEITHYW